MADIYTPEQRSVDAIKGVMSTRAGRRYIYELLARCGLLQTSFSPDALVLSFNEGQRNIGISVYSDVDAHCPEQYLLMLKEAKEDEQYDRHNTSNGDSSGDGYDFDSE